MLSIAYFFCSTFFDNKFISLFLSLLKVALNVGGGYETIISFTSILRRGSTVVSMLLRPAVPIFKENDNILNKRSEEKTISSQCIHPIYKYITIYVIGILQYKFPIRFKSLKWN